MRTLGIVPIILMLLAVDSRGGSGSTTMLIQVRPEVALSQPDANSIQVMIRVRQGANASVWSADVCELPAAGAFRISRSGIYRIPLSQLSGQGASHICLTSSDGSLSAQVTISGPAR